MLDSLVLVHSQPLCLPSTSHQPATEMAYLLALPEEVLLHVASLLDLKDVLALLLVSQRYCDNLKCFDVDVWKACRPAELSISSL